MYSTELESAFQVALNARGLSVDRLDASGAIAAVIDFYLSQRLNDVDLDSGGDGLLFQWGTYDWGKGPSFEVDFTRQTISGEGGDDEDMWQLNLTLHYKPSAETAALGRGERWCWSPGEVPEFREWIESLPCVRFALDHVPESIELCHGDV